MDKIIEEIIQNAIDSYDGSYTLENHFEKSVSFSELVDKLSIVNFKLFTLKNEVANNQDEKFRAWASYEDINLVKERSNLKKCINEKLVAIVSRIVKEGKDDTAVPEFKQYGN